MCKHGAVASSKHVGVLLQGTSNGNSNGVTREEGRIIMPGSIIDPWESMIVVEAEPFPLGQHTPIGRADVVEEAWEADAAEP